MGTGLVKLKQTNVGIFPWSGHMYTNCIFLILAFKIGSYINMLERNYS